MISVKIDVSKKATKSSDSEIYFFFICPDLAFYNRWAWFFRLKYAQAIIRNPRNFVEMYTSSDFKLFEPSENQKNGYIQAQISKIENAIERYKSEYNSLFPIEQDEIFIKLHKKLAEKKSKNI